MVSEERQRIMETNRSLRNIKNVGHIPPSLSPSSHNLTQALISPPIFAMLKMIPPDADPPFPRNSRPSSRKAS